LTSVSDFEIFLSAPPGLENLLHAEAVEAGFTGAKVVGGGVVFQGGWPEVWRANLTLRGPSKVLVRIGEFRAFHLAQLDKRARKFPWGDILNPAYSVKAEVVTNRKSKIYHAGAAIERIERAISEELGAPIAPNAPSADIVIKARIDDNNVRFSVDSSGEGLHKRGHKQAMGKAPIRETMAALLLRGCGYNGQETVLDPMCGSGTFLIEAAEISRGILAGRSRRFAFEKLRTFNPVIVDEIKGQWTPQDSPHRFYGSDRNVNVIGFSKENARRAGVEEVCHFEAKPLSMITRPKGPPGLVIVNPPYGARVGKKKDLYALYSAFGDVMRERFKGWRVGMVTADHHLAQATRLPWKSGEAPIAHGGLRVRLYRTEAL
jgi:putative N6-adenine-specific DNA methylase